MPVSKTKPGYPNGLEPNRAEELFDLQQTKKYENQIFNQKDKEPIFLKETLQDPAKMLIQDQKNEGWNRPQSKPVANTPSYGSKASVQSNFNRVNSTVKPTTQLVSNMEPQQKIGYPTGQEPKHKANEFFLNLKIIGQLKESYILCEGPDGLVIVDQHAAAERANFERIQREFEKPVTVTQPLLVPISIPLSSDLIANIGDLNEKTAFYGLKFHVVDDYTVELREEPSWMTLVDQQKTLEDLFTWFQQHQIVDVKELRRHMIATCACHSSIRFNHALSMDQMESILEDLVQCDQPYHCPHGRPTVVSNVIKRTSKGV